MMILLTHSLMLASMHTHYNLSNQKRAKCTNINPELKAGSQHKGNIMAKVTYKDKKSGKEFSKKTMENFYKKQTGKKIEKVGKVYKVANTKYKAGK